MTRKDFQAIADALASVRPSYRDIDPMTFPHEAHQQQGAQLQWEHTCRAIGDVFAADNPNFDRTRFVQACLKGVSDGK